MRDHNYEIENCLKLVVKEIWNQRRSVGIKLAEDNARAHIHSDIINCLREEGLNIMAYPTYSPDRCTM